MAAPLSKVYRLYLIPCIYRRVPSEHGLLPPQNLSEH